MSIWLIFLVFAGLSALVQWRLRSKFAEYSQIGLANGMSGAEIAKKMLQQNGIYDVTIESVEGQLTDHYDPIKKTVNLSQDVYAGRSISAAAVAAHECGHAVQHQLAYAPLRLRSALVPALSVSSRYLQWIILIGIFTLQMTPIPLMIGVALFALTTLFSFVTLPVEFDASRRALVWIKTNNIVTDREYASAKDALWWAASTYVVAALGSLATLLYYVSILSGSSGRRNG